MTMICLIQGFWKLAPYGFEFVVFVIYYDFSLSDRKPVEKEDEIVVMVLPDYQMLEYVERIASDLSDDPVMLKSFLFQFFFTSTLGLNFHLLSKWKT